MFTFQLCFFLNRPGEDIGGWAMISVGSDRETYQYQAQGTTTTIHTVHTNSILNPTSIGDVTCFSIILKRSID